MRLYAAAFSKEGRELIKRIETLPLAVDYGSLPCRGGRKVQTKVCLRGKESLAEWSRQAFDEGAPLVFVGAAGIAVRAVAEHIASKTADSPVLVVDEKGHFVIPLLSGHLGGANELAVQIAEGIGAAPVITTGTDVHHLFAVDVFARKNGLRVVNTRGIAAVSAKLLAGQQVTLAIEGCEQEELQYLAAPSEVRLVAWSTRKKALPEHGTTDIVIASGESGLENAVLGLKPKQLVLGIGCKKGKTYTEIKEVIDGAEAKGLLQKEELAGIASIDVKQGEEGIIELAERLRIPFYVFSKEELQAVPGKYQGSGFVESIVGVDNVCERSAVAASGGGELLVSKQAVNGVTFAVAKRNLHKNAAEWLHVW